jgi:hypothetical protein
MTRIFAPLLASTLVLAAGACGGSGTGAGSPRPAAYKDMNHEQREQFMKDVVLPKAKEVFAAFDPQFKKMDCKTCHGDGAGDGTFKMPNPKIHVLPGSKEAFMAWVAKEPDMGRWGKFMGEQVEPMMAQLLQMSVFDPETKTGEFSCMGCHVIEGVTPPPSH